MPIGEIETRFSDYELRRLELAEWECPWGESAENLRTIYLADVVRAMLGDKKAGEEAGRILRQLLGPAPKKRRRGPKTRT